MLSHSMHTLYRIPYFTAGSQHLNLESHSESLTAVLPATYLTGLQKHKEQVYTSLLVYQIEVEMKARCIMMQISWYEARTEMPSASSLPVLNQLG